MSMRITSNMMTTQLLSNLNNNVYTSSKLSNQASTGRKLNTPSDDPVGATYALRYRAEISSTAQYDSNVSTSLSWLDYTDSVMGQAGEVMTKLKELTVQGSSETMSDTDLQAIKKEMEELKEQLVSIGNSEITGKYVFNGQQYDNKPYALTDTVTSYDQISTDNGSVSYMISEGVNVPINVSGNDFFGSSTDEDNIFKVLDTMLTALDAGDSAAFAGQLNNLESRTETMLTGRAQIGARTNRVELVQARLSERSSNLTEMQSAVEDAEIDEVLIQATQAQTIYQAALKSSASIMSTSLVDYMS